MSDDIETDPSEFANKIYVFKTNVPLKFAEELKDWNDVCKRKAPDGFDDYRWGKMMYDHYFVKNYKPLIELLIQKVEELSDKIDFLSNKLDAKKVNDENKDLLK